MLSMRFTTTMLVALASRSSIGSPISLPRQFFEVLLFFAQAISYNIAPIVLF